MLSHPVHRLRRLHRTHSRLGERRVRVLVVLRHGVERCWGGFDGGWGERGVGGGCRGSGVTDGAENVKRQRSMDDQRHSKQENVRGV